MQVTVLREIPEDSQLASSWNNLAMRMERPEVFFTHQWALAASHAFEDILRPLVFLVYDADQLCGVAALATSRESLRNAVFLTASTADYCDFLSEPDMRNAMLAVIFDQIRKLGVQDLELANIPSKSATLRELSRIAQARHFYLHERAAYGCGVISLGSDQERQSVLQSVKRKGRQGLKMLAELGPVRLAHFTSEQVDVNLTSLFSAQISRFLATFRVSPLLRPERRFFLIELSRLLGQAGWLKISRLEVNGQPVAWNYGFRYCGSWFWYLPTFKMQYEDSSPGICLLRLLVEEACADLSVNRLDLGLGGEAYKERFANASCPTSYVQLSTSWLRHEKIAGRQWLVSSLERFRGLETKIRKARDWSHDLRSRIRETGLTSTTAHGFRRATNYLASDHEVLLFEASLIETPNNGNMTLARLEFEQLADAAISNAEDVQTLRYLMRCAARLKGPAASGFFLRAQDAQAKHFLWVGQYDGFHLSEIDHNLEPLDPDAIMLFDCWTPASHRGHGCYTLAIRLAAALLQQQGKRAWIFSAASNEASVRGIRKAGFVHRFSLVRKNRLGHSTVTRRDQSSLVP